MFIIRRCVVQTEPYFLKRSFFRYCSSVTCSNSIQEEELIKFDNKQKLQGNKKLLKVAMLGLPNAGKSTLVNKLIHRSVCPTSSKVHTTMHKAEAVYTEGNTQIVFMDTPGLITTKEFDRYKLIETFKQDPANSVNEADLIAIVQDVTNVYTRHKFDDFVLDTVKNRKEDTQLLLILNKVDKLKKKLALLNVTRILTNKEHYPKFDDIFMVSALDGDGVDDLRNYLLDSAKIKDWKYETKFYTDQPLETIIEQTVRAKLMDVLPDEMPYKVKIRTEHCDFGDDGSIVSVVVLDCPRKNYVKMLLKKKCFKIKFLAFRVEVELRHAFRKPVFIKLNAICTKSELNK
ncbi:GTPase Era, mitochondrial [Habropoda laboriosa]|uniref:GTPase Era, mitochondrial n=1 Tax=Habropoda laboriosa TaxID=597456 RepID=A0A0L7QM31_9HYME|nr:PREDICTED: GTPase Era, mitochondrial [Habropoda laboriosa]KOC59624.1 GTPase Era, mitochondrial [Habropoda laboriosa]